MTEASITPGTAGSVTIGGLHLDVSCGAPSMIGFQPIDMQPSPGGPLSQLTGALNAPETFERGTSMTYTVTLTNPTEAEIRLEPCPSYTQFLVGGGKNVSQTYLLNCTPVQIPAHGSSSFEMRMVVPADFPGDAAKLSWQLEVLDGTAVGKAVGLR
jgi:hypothetical protein